jgi:hypothetical protein
MPVPPGFAMAGASMDLFVLSSLEQELEDTVSSCQIIVACVELVALQLCFKVCWLLRYRSDSVEQRVHQMERTS